MNMTKKTIHKISDDVTTDENIFFGLVTFEKEHKLCWAINEKMQINLKISELENADFYIYNDKYLYLLIPNKTISGVKFAEIKNIDFVFKISGINLIEVKEKYMKLLKGIEFISAVVEIDINKQKKLKKALLTF